MKILLSSYLYKPNIGGVENSIMYLSKALKEQGHEPIIIASDYNQLEPSKRLLKQELIDGIQVYRFKSISKKNKLRVILNPVFCINRCAKLINTITKGQTDIIHLTRDYRNVIAHHQSLIKNTRCVYLVPSIFSELDAKFSNKGNSVIELFKKALITNQHIKMQKNAFCSATENWVFSEKISGLVKKISNDKAIIKVVTPGIDSNVFQAINQPIKLANKTKLGINPNKITCLCLGRFSKEKNFLLSLQAFTKLPSDKFQLLLVGDGSEKHQYERYIKDNSLSNIYLYPQTLVPIQYYSASDIFLMTSLEESFGQTIIEAAAVGLEIIALKGEEINTQTENILGNKSNYCKNNERDLAEKILEVSNKKDTNSIEMHNFITKRYNWHKLALQLVQNE